MLDEVALQKGMVKVVEEFFGDKITKAIVKDQPGPRPKSPYIALKILNIDTIGQADVVQPAKNIQQTKVNEDNDILVTFEAYGANSKGLMAHFKLNIISNDYFRNQFKALGLAVRRPLQVIDVTTLVANEFEQRAKVDASFNYANRETINIGIVGTVNIDQTVDGGNETQQTTTSYTASGEC